MISGNANNDASKARKARREQEHNRMGVNAGDVQEMKDRQGGDELDAEAVQKRKILISSNKK